MTWSTYLIMFKPVWHGTGHFYTLELVKSYLDSWFSKKNAVKIELFWHPKGQIKPKADWHAIDSPQKRTDECLFLCFFTLHGKKNQIRSFVFWENLRPANLLTVLSDLYPAHWVLKKLPPDSAKHEHFSCFVISCQTGLTVMASAYLNQSRLF